MRIDLDGLTPVADITIALSRTDYFTTFVTPSDWDSPAVAAILALNGIDDIRVDNYRKSSNHLAVKSKNYDRFQIAERIATQCETHGLQVQRLTFAEKGDASGRIPVQSFVLAWQGVKE